MIKPHGAEALQPRYVSNNEERAALANEAEFLPSMLLNSAAAANVVMLGAGYFTPLTGFMDIADAMSVATDMRTSDGLFWPVPILNLASNVDGIDGGRRIALRDPQVDGNPVMAVMEVSNLEELTGEQLDVLTETTFGTLDDSHPGVATFRSLGRYCVSGDIQVLNFSYFATEFEGTFRTAVEGSGLPNTRTARSIWQQRSTCMWTGRAAGLPSWPPSCA